MRVKHSRRRVLRLSLVRLEDRTLPASTITVVVGANGSGTLDGFLFDATPGTIMTTDGGNNPGTLSTGALTAVAAGTSISVGAQAGISFSDLGGTLTLQTGLGGSVGFNAGSGALTVANGLNTLATGGSGFILTAGTNLALFNLNSNGGDVTLTAGTSAAGNLSARTILTAGSGNITLQSTNAAGGTIVQSGIAFGLAITATATGTVTIDALRGTNISATSNSGSVSSAGSNAIQGSGQLTLSAASGITVNTLVPAVQAMDNLSGNISITQEATPAQSLATSGTGVRDQVAGGSVNVTNLGGSVTVAAGSPVQTNNGPITLAGRDLNLAGTVNSGTGRTTLANSTAGLPIDLGTNTAGSIGLTQGEVGNVTAGVLQVGSPTAGAITISAAITAPAGWKTLTLISGDNVSELVGGSLTVPNLRISSAGPTSDPNVLDRGNTVGVVGCDCAAAVQVTDVSAMVVGVVDGDVGVSSPVVVELEATDIDIQQPINAGTGIAYFQVTNGSIQFNLGGNGGPGSFGLSDAELGRITAGQVDVIGGPVTVSSPITRHPGYSTLEIFGGAITQTAALSVANLFVRFYGSVTLTNAGNDVDALTAQVIGSGQTFAYQDANSFALGTPPISGLSISITDPGGTVSLFAAGAITNGNGTATDVQAAMFTAIAAISVDVHTQVSQVSAILTGNGSITLTEANNAECGTLNAGTGPTATITLAGGGFSIDANNIITPNTTLIVSGANVTIGSGVSLSVASFRLTSGSVTGSGTLTSSNSFDVQSGFLGCTLGGASGATGMVKSTTGTVILGSFDTYTGTTTVNAGTLEVDSPQVASGVAVTSGGTLAGIGKVAAPVVATLGGTVMPGIATAGPGILNTGNFQLMSGSTFSVKVNGPYTTAGTDYAQANVTGTVNLGGATLVLIGGAVAPPAGKVLTIINNDGTDPVTGTFNGLPSGSTVAVGGFYARISYTGGDGNDVTLTTFIPPPAVVQNVTIDDGTAQRSMVRSVTVAFGRLVGFIGTPAAAFQLARTGPGTTGNVTLAVDLSGSTATQTVAKLTFSGALTEGSAATPSLIDGDYTLTILSGQVGGGIQDGDNLTSLFRLFGDVNGDRAVDGLDLTAFRNAFGSVQGNASYLAYLDFNGDGAIDGADLTQFRNRFGVILP
jgi:autotransporter-associated beta strand protein